MNVATTPILSTTVTPKHHSDDTKTLEDKLFSKIAALKSYFFYHIFDVRNYITLLKENHEKEKPADSKKKKSKVLLLEEKIKFLEPENSFLKSGINI